MERDRRIPQETEKSGKWGNLCNANYMAFLITLGYRFHGPVQPRRSRIVLFIPPWSACVSSSDWRNSLDSFSLSISAILCGKPHARVFRLFRGSAFATAFHIPRSKIRRRVICDRYFDQDSTTIYGEFEEISSLRSVLDLQITLSIFRVVIWYTYLLFFM